jgi:UDP-N-acetyl-D-mannosaminuronic acid dehydrogenase
MNTSKKMKFKEVPEINKQTICIVGMGFVGLTLAVVLAESGFEVTGIEINKNTLNKISNGKTHFYELGLEQRLKAVINNGSLKIKQKIESKMSFDIYIITVGTPLNEKGEPNLTMVKRATQEVVSAMKGSELIILRSTVQIGTTRNIVLPLLKASKLQFSLAFCPERTIEGNALAELKSLPQICGGLNDIDTWRAATLFQSITPTTMRVKNLETAELIKLLDNSYRDLFFSFGNEVAMICDSVGVDAHEVINLGGFGYERTNIANPGLVGGPCLEKDPHILEFSLKKLRCIPRLIKTGRNINENLIKYTCDKIFDHIKKNKLNPLKIAITGMAFKGRPETDDLRGTPSKLLIEKLKELFPLSKIVIHDFACDKHSLKIFSGCRVVSIKDVFEKSDIVFVANNNLKYQKLDLFSLANSMSKKSIIYDFWNQFDFAKDHMPSHVNYYSLGGYNKLSKNI